MVKLTALLSWSGYHNIPKKYIQRKMFKGVVYENSHYITPPVIYNYTKDWIFDEHAPWTTEAEMTNDPTTRNRKPAPIVPPVFEWLIFRGDRVEIMNGKDAGKQGIVNAIVKPRNWVYVEGLNTKMSGYNLAKNASIVSYLKREQPLVIYRDVKLIDPSDYKPCDAVFRYTEKGEKIRVSKRTGMVIPIPPDAESTVDYVSKSTYKPAAKDSANTDMGETYVAKYASVEDDLTEEYGMEKLPKRAETYKY